MTMQNKKQSKIWFFFKSIGSGRITVLTLAAFVVAFMELAGIFSIVPYIAILSNPSLLETNKYLAWLYKFSGAASPSNFMIILGIAIILILLSKNLLTGFAKYLQYKFSYRVQHVLASKLLASYLAKEYSFFTTHNTSLLLRNVVSISDSLVRGILVPMLMLLTDIMVLCFITVALLLVEPMAVLLVVVVFGGLTVVTHKLLTKKITRLGDVRNTTSGKLHEIIAQSMQGIRDVKILQKERFFMKKFDKTSLELTNGDAVFMTSMEIPPLIHEFVGLTAIVFLVILMIRWKVEFQSIIPMISFFVVAAYRISPIIGRLSHSLQSLKYYDHAMEIFYNDLVMCEQDDAGKFDEHEGSERIAFNDSIVLQGISYRYSGGVQALKNINLTIHKNKAVAFVGGSGAGKTTLVDILAGFLEPQEGSIEVDGVKVTQANKKAWTRSIGYIPQNIYLMDSSFKNNIAFGVEEDAVDQGRFDKAVRISQLEQVIKDAGGREADLGERGIRLSGGQSQRVGIARSLYNDPDLLIMDEATAALDNKTEAEIVDNLEKLTKEKTVIVVAHRLTTIKECDVIFVMKDGEVVDSGTYDGLLESSEYFRELAREVK